MYGYDFHAWPTGGRDHIHVLHPAARQAVPAHQSSDMFCAVFYPGGIPYVVAHRRDIDPLRVVDRSIMAAILFPSASPASGTEDPGGRSCRPLKTSPAGCARNSHCTGPPSCSLGHTCIVLWYKHQRHDLFVDLASFSLRMASDRPSVSLAMPTIPVT